MTDQIAYTTEYQIKLLAYMLLNNHFAELCGDCLVPEQFADKSLQWFFLKLGKSKPCLSKVTLKEELIKAASRKEIRAEEVPRYLELYKFIGQSPTPDEQEHLKGTLNKFIRTQNVKRAIMDSLDLIKDQKWEDIETRVSEAVSSGVDVMSTGMNFFADIENRLERRRTRAPFSKIATLIPEIDQLTYGGIKNKQVGMVAGGTGRGKSLLLQQLGQSALLQGKKVCYVTLELSEEDIAERYDTMFARIRPQELTCYDKEALEKLDGYRSKYGESLFIKHFPTGDATIIQIQSYAKQLSMLGIQIDLWLIDYIDVIKPHVHYNDKFSETEAIIQGMCGMAQKQDTRIWTATQLNRAGMVSETPDESSIAGAINKLYNVDIAILMAQNSEARELAEMNLIMTKNRNGPAGKKIKLDTDYTYYTFYKPPIVRSPALESEDDDSESDTDSESAELSGEA